MARTLRPQKRSVSPFGTAPQKEPDVLTPLDEAFLAAFPDKPSEAPRQLKGLEHLPFIPHFIRKSWEAPSNDAAQLDHLCRFLLHFRVVLAEKKLDQALYGAMQELFDRKTELFLIDHFNRENCEKMGWPEDHRDIVLFAKERNTLVGVYFSSITENEPGRFSEFVTRWVESESPDRILHFLDFCLGYKNPTFDYYLLFTHPGLARLVSNKERMRGLLDKVAPVLKKVSSPTWEADVRKVLQI